MVGAMLCLQGSAQATLSIQLSDNSPASTVVFTTATNSIALVGITVGNFTISVTAATSNVPGDHPSTLTISDTTITLNSGVAASITGHTLQIKVSATDYSIPTGGSLTLGSSGGGTWNGSTSSGDTVAYRSWFDTTNSGTFGAGTGTAGITTTSNGGNPNSQSATDTSVAVSKAANSLYALSSITTVTMFEAASKHTQVNTQGTTTVDGLDVASVPEPSTMALAGLGALGLIGYGLRRRKAQGA